MALELFTGKGCLFHDDVTGLICGGALFVPSGKLRAELGFLQKIVLSSVSIPSGVAEMKHGRPIAMRPTLTGWKPSTSFR